MVIMFEIHRFIQLRFLPKAIFSDVQLGKKNRNRAICVFTFLITSLWGFQGNANTLSLQQVQLLALDNDPFLEGSELRETAFKYESEGANSWDNPKIISTLQNIPVNHLSLGQEPMSQVKLGIQQALPRGNSATLSRDVFLAKASKQQVVREARRAWLLQNVSMRWLTWYQAHSAIELLNEEAQQLSQLLETVESAYRSGAGNTRQQDIIDIRIEILRLNDTLMQQKQAKAEAFAQLSRYIDIPANWQNFVPAQFNLSRMLARVESLNQYPLMDILAHHPAVRLVAMDESIETAKLALAREQTKPKWAFEASYGYRQDASSGSSQADFVSLGVQVDLPLFGSKRQDANVSAAAARVSAVATQRRLEIRRLSALAEAAKSQLLYLNARRNQYRADLLRQGDYLTDATLTAYTNDNGAFSEVIRARISQLNTQLDALNIDISLAGTTLELLYLYDPVRSKVKPQFTPSYPSISLSEGAGQ